MPSNLENMLHTQTRIRDKRAHQQLKYDLVEHIWKKSIVKLYVFIYVLKNIMSSVYKILLIK